MSAYIKIDKSKPIIIVKPTVRYPEKLVCLLPRVILIFITSRSRNSREEFVVEIIK